MIPLDFKYMFNRHERMNSKSRHNRNFDYFHPSTHTSAKVTIHIHSIYIDVEADLVIVEQSLLFHIVSLES